MILIILAVVVAAIYTLVMLILSGWMIVTDWERKRRIRKARR